MNIVKFKNNSNKKSYLTVSVLGNSLKLNVKFANISSVNLNKTNTQINIVLPNKYKKVDNMNIINLSIQKLYTKIAETEIEYAMEIARHILKFAPEDYTLKRLDNSFYKIIKNKLIINPDIVKYNKTIINTTIIQAFCKIKFKPNSKAYKNLLNQALLEYETHYNTVYGKFLNLKIS